MSSNVFVCICTYKRPSLLQKLIEDLLSQTDRFNRIIIVDGDPSSEQVISVLRDYENLSFVYVPSNHANISFQRYLGWKVAKRLNAEILLYLDDDMRIYQKEALEILLRPLNVEDETIIGSTAPIIFPTNIVDESKRRGLINRFLSKLKSFSWNNKNTPGSLTATGVRILPADFSPEGYGRVKWAYGGVMAFKMNKLGEDSFLEDSFALHHIGCGLGEDTLISHIASKKGDILLIRSAEFLHPNADESKAHSREAYKFGYATAYSRRIINDHQHSDSTFKKRLFLFGSYLSNNILNILLILLTMDAVKIKYETGYFFGSFRGLFKRPTASYLTPEINWWKDAETAISRMVEF
jgi:glycosyltransferase involved in cell wall biosynthesis